MNKVMYRIDCCKIIIISNFFIILNIVCENMYYKNYDFIYQEQYLILFLLYVGFFIKMYEMKTNKLIEDL